ncbi:helix-turn-helix domain-containing protein [Aquirufa novilacunae]|jgi:AraC-like DNA-binding protein|uniref:Helix-turn-helix domain-containing protein n=1 Tax=Aquirufa novilacunae TaxID=3139305 RepID=A0ABW8U078_9BACT
MSNAGSVYLFSIVSSLCVLFGLNFLFRKGNLLVAKILAVEFLLLGYMVVAAYFLMPVNIIETPYFFRTLAPLFYTLPPLNFMFLWYLFHPRATFKKSHLLFFLPFILQLIENTPFFLSDKATKIAEVKWMLAQGDYFAFSERFMWFDPICHVYAKFVMYVLFYVAMVYFYVQFRREKQNQILFEKGIFHYWVIGILVFRLCTVFYIWYTFIYTDNGKASFITTDYLLVAEFVFHLFYLAINPKLLDVKILAENLRGPEKTEVILTDEEGERLQHLAAKIEAYFRTTEVFLNSQLTAELLGSLTGHPHRMIGQAIKYTHGISFRDYLNNYRISYIEEKLSDPTYLAKSSIETIAEASGFGSRQSFYTAFKKAKGCTPKEYFSSRIG